MASIALSAEQKALAASKTTLRGQIGSMFSGVVSNVDTEIARVEGLITSSNGDVSRVESKFDAEVARIDGVIGNLDSVYSTDAERIAAVADLLAGYTAADTTLQGLLETAIATKASSVYVDGKVAELVAADAANLAEAKAYADAKDAARKTYVDNTFVTTVGLDAALGSLAEMGL